MVLMTCPGADIAKRLFVNKSSSLWLLYSLKVNKHSVRKKKSKKPKKKHTHGPWLKRNLRLESPSPLSWCIIVADVVTVHRSRRRHHKLKDDSVTRSV